MPPSMRSFPSPTGADRAGDTITVARLRVPVAEAARHVARSPDLRRVAELRTADAGAPRSWASCVRSPRTSFDFKAAAGKSLVSPGRARQRRRGTTSGANHVFYLERPRARALGIEPRVLWPLIRSPRDLTGHIESTQKDSLAGASASGGSARLAQISTRRALP